MEKFKYFTYGYPDHLALPTYALYQPVLDCFLITVESPKVANQLQILLSSRYSLYTVCLNTADNYTHNLIDNTICENWTFSGRKQLPVTQINKVDQIVYADHLELIDHNPGCDIDREKQWFFLCNFYLDFFNTFKEYTSPSAQAVMEILPNDCFGYWQHTIEQEVMEILYLGTDFEQADLRIQQLINTDTLMLKFFKIFKK
jgi:hypothetical protein